MTVNIKVDNSLNCKAYIIKCKHGCRAECKFSYVGNTQGNKEKICDFCRTRFFFLMPERVHLFDDSTCAKTHSISTIRQY